MTPTAPLHGSDSEEDEQVIQSSQPPPKRRRVQQDDLPPALRALSHDSSDYDIEGFD
jgi:hypothetical protein